MNDDMRIVHSSTVEPRAHKTMDYKQYGHELLKPANICGHLVHVIQTKDTLIINKSIADNYLYLSAC